MENVVDFSGVTRLKSDPQRILQQALDVGMTAVVVVGFDADGEEYFAASDADGGDALWHLARAQHKLLSVQERL